MKTAIQNVRDWKVEPIRWGANQAGMQAKDEEVPDVEACRTVWNNARESACYYAEKLHNLGLHKQWAARVLEPFSMMKMVETATDWSNFFWLRDHKDAQPEMAELAHCLREAFKQSTPVLLRPGDWHVPYYRSGFWSKDDTAHYVEEETLENALKISASCCAQVSYRKQDDSLAKAIDLYDRLVGADRKHASPFEHQATPIKVEQGDEVEIGITHRTIKRGDKGGSYWSGNLRGWIQNRQLIPGNVVWDLPL